MSPGRSYNNNEASNIRSTAALLITRKDKISLEVIRTAQVRSIQHLHPQFDLAGSSAHTRSAGQLSMWYSVAMNSSIEDEMLVDSSIASGDHYQPLIVRDARAPWVDSAMEYKALNANAAGMPYHSFDWAPIDRSDSQYTPSTLKSSDDTIGSYDFSTGLDTMPNNSYLPYQESDNFLGPPRYMTSAYASSRSGGESQKDEPKIPHHRPKMTGNMCDARREPRPTQKTSLETPKRQRLPRRYSDQSTTSLKSASNSTSNPNERCSGNTSVANEAHIIAERRYRNNLNAKIAQIQTALQEARFRSHSGDAYRSRGGTYFNSELGSHETDATSPVSSGGKDRRRKADILDEAAEYIRYADLELRHLAEEVQWLKGALAACQGQNYDPPHQHHGQ